jgi:hypothetical protein
MGDHFAKRQMPNPSNFFDGSRCSRRESFYDRSPTYLGRKLIKYQREEETGKEREKKRCGQSRRYDITAPVVSTAKMAPAARGVAALRRIKRAWASTFRANSAFDDLRPRRIGVLSPPSSPLLSSPLLSAALSTLVDPSCHGSPATVHGKHGRIRTRIADFARAHYTYTISTPAVSRRFRNHVYSSMHDFPPSVLAVYYSLAAGPTLLRQNHRTVSHTLGILFSLQRNARAYRFLILSSERVTIFTPGVISILIHVFHFRFDERPPCEISPKLGIILLY